MDFLAGKISSSSERAGVLTMNTLSSGVEWDPHHSKVWDIAIAGDSSTDFSGLPWIELERIFREELSALFSEKSKAAETAAAIQKRWEIVLSELEL